MGSLINYKKEIIVNQREEGKEAMLLQDHPHQRRLTTLTATPKLPSLEEIICSGVTDKELHSVDSINRIKPSLSPPRNFNIPEAGSSSVVVNSLAYDRRGDALLVEEAELVGIDGRKRELMGWVMDGGARLGVISVVGMGGLGKTTLVKKVYDDAAVKKHFQSHAWITVSESFKIEELLRDTIHQLFDETKQPRPKFRDDSERTNQWWDQQSSSLINSWLACKGTNSKVWHSTSFFAFIWCD
ncbi:Uncharacterized protein Fot_18215 [Forsythia ovata]|uniref:NB-ARC domain-containing protein n=1 Tax=Forsythia ovata TaxID=205694 RepID=A0ABD1VHL7_9LAMI